MHFSSYHIPYAKMEQLSVTCNNLEDIVKDLELVGTGNFSKVYKLDEDLVLKVIEDPEPVADEIRLLTGLNGTGITPQVYYCAICSNAAFLVMEYLKGQTLLDFVDRYEDMGEIPVSFLQWLIPRLMTKLTLLHKNHIQHNDLHPGNVFVTLVDNQPIDVFLIDLGNSSAWSSNNEDFDYFATTLINGYGVSKEVLERLTSRTVNIIDPFDPD